MPIALSLELMAVPSRHITELFFLQQVLDPGSVFINALLAKLCPNQNQNKLRPVLYTVETLMVPRTKKRKFIHRSENYPSN